MKNIAKLLRNINRLNYDILDKDLIGIIIKNDDKLNILTGNNGSYNNPSNTISSHRNSKKELVFHELGHFIDDVIHNDSDDYASHKMFKIPVYDNVYIKNSFHKEFWYIARRSSETMCIQDIILILSNGILQYKYRRPMEYFNTIRIKKAELFANLFSIKLSGNKKNIDFISAYFPELWVEFNNTIKCGGSI